MREDLDQLNRHDDNSKVSSSLTRTTEADAEQNQSLEIYTFFMSDLVVLVDYYKIQDWCDVVTKEALLAPDSGSSDSWLSN